MQYDSSELQDMATIILKCHFHLLPWEASLVCAICFSAQASRRSEKKTPTALFGFERTLNDEGYGWILSWKLKSF